MKPEDEDEPKGKFSKEQMAKRARSYIARAKKAALKSEKGLSEWEDEFLNSLDERLEKYGKAFNDPDLGAMNAPLSLLQGLKVREIKNKHNFYAKNNGAQNKNYDLEDEGEEENKEALPKKEKKIRKPLKAKKPLLRKSPLKNKLKK